MLQADTPVTPDSLRQIWDRVTQQVKDTVNMPSLWRALEAARPVALDGGVFVIGFPPSEYYQRGLLQDGRHRNLIEQLLTRLAPAVTQIRIIEGTEVSDWESLKAMERASQAMRKEARTRREAEEVHGEDWEAIGEQLSRRYAQLPHRMLPPTQAEYLASCVETLANAYRTLMPATGEPPETLLRAYARVLDRVAERTGVPAALIGYLVRQQTRC